MKYAMTIAASLLLAASANAVTVTSTTGPDSGPAAGETVLFDFNSATPELSGNYALVTGNGSGYAAPLGDATQFLVVPGNGGSGTATLDLSSVGPIKSFSFYWGSIDTYNYVDLFNASGFYQRIGGSMLPPANGAQGDAATNRRVFFTLGAGESLTSINFVSDGVAFEIDDFAVGAVPEPQSWALMLIGFGFVGMAARRKSRPAAVVA